jgi:beta propeller repeat protein
MKKLIVMCLALALSLVSILGPSINTGTISSPKPEVINGSPLAPLSATTQSLPMGEFPICTDPANQGSPAISGDIVVWEDWRNGNGDIYGYDLSTQTEFPLCTDPADQRVPAISGDIVVWQDDRNGNRDIYGYDLTTQTEFQIATDPANQEYPTISGDIVVWHDDRNGNRDIYGYDLTTQTEFQITTDPASQEYPAIWGDIVVWRDYCNDNYDIYGYELSTQTEFPICTDPAGQYDPAIWGDIVVWRDYRNGNGDIYGQQFAQPIAALQVEPLALAFNVSGSTVTPAVQEVNIAKIGSGALDWAVFADVDWLDLDPISGAAPSTMNVSVVFADLAGDSYTGHITVVGTTPGSVNSPQTVTVSIGGAGREVSGTIDVDTTWTVADGPYIVSGDVTVNNGVTLIIEHGVGVIFETSDILSSGQDPDKTELIVGGTLVADGVTFTSHASEPAAGDWYGIRFLESSIDYGDSGCIIENSTIEYGTVGISIDGASPLISNNTITEIKGNNADLDRDAGDGVGILVTNGSSPTLTNNTISSVRGGDGYEDWSPRLGRDSGDGHGICVRNDSSALIANNTISYVTGAPGQYSGGGFLPLPGYASGRGIGIFVESSQPTITDNTISNIEGGSYGAYSASVHGYPASTGVGIYLEASSPTIANNSISLVNGGRGVPGSIGAGIFADNGSSPTVSRNTISGIQGGDGENAWCWGSACQYGASVAGNGGLGTGIYAGTNSALTTDANILSLISGGNGGNGREDPYCGYLSGADGGIGTGIYAIGSSLKASNSVIYLTRGGDGGTGAPSHRCSPGDGGDGGVGIGIYIERSSANLVNNTTASSSGGSGGASGGEGASSGSDGSSVGVNVASSVDIVNNIVVSHTIGISGTTTAATLSHNDVWGNSEANYSGVAPGTNDISADPLFVDPDNNDYHLRWGSPAIDAGTNEGAPPADFEDDPRPLDGNLDGIAVVDIGADEFKSILIPVGGFIVRVSKLELLAPWICLGLLALVAGILLVRRHILEQG